MDSATCLHVRAAAHNQVSSFSAKVSDTATMAYDATKGHYYSAERAPDDMPCNVCSKASKRRFSPADVARTLRLALLSEAKTNDNCSSGLVAILQQ